MSRQLHRRHGGRMTAVAAVAALGLGAAACSSNSAPNSSGGGKVTISINCAPTQANNPVQHKEWVEDVALFEKANRNITVKSVYNYPCEVPATFTAMLRAGTEPDIFYTYFTDLRQGLLSGQAADITPYVNSTTVPTLKDIVPGAGKAGTAGSTIYGLPTSNYTQGLIYNRALFAKVGMGPLPSLTGTPAGSLGGGNTYVFAKHDTPAQIRAGIKFINFEDLTPGTGQFNFARTKADGLPVGFPEPQLFAGATGAKINALRAKYATINTAYSAPYVNANEPDNGEPVDAQAVYKTLDPVMLAVLTQSNANIKALLKTAAGNVNTILANSGL